jgi:hypothetical protein
MFDNRLELQILTMESRDFAIPILHRHSTVDEIGLSLQISSFETTYGTSNRYFSYDIRRQFVRHFFAREHSIPCQAISSNIQYPV